MCRLQKREPCPSVNPPLSIFSHCHTLPSLHDFNLFSLWYRVRSPCWIAGSIPSTNTGRSFGPGWASMRTSGLQACSHTHCITGSVSLAHASHCLKYCIISFSPHCTSLSTLPQFPSFNRRGYWQRSELTITQMVQDKWCVQSFLV